MMFMKQIRQNIYSNIVLYFFFESQIQPHVFARVLVRKHLLADTLTNNLL